MKRDFNIGDLEGEPLAEAVADVMNGLQETLTTLSQLMAKYDAGEEDPFDGDAQIKMSISVHPDVKRVIQLILNASDESFTSARVVRAILAMGCLACGSRVMGAVLAVALSDPNIRDAVNAEIAKEAVLESINPDDLPVH